MNSKRVLACAIGFLILTGCARTISATPAEKENTWISKPADGYPSAVTEAECYLCRYAEEGADLFPNGGLQDNIGVINLNTFETRVIQINRYDPLGNLIEEYAGAMEMGRLASTETAGFDATVALFPDRGYADIDLYPEDSAKLDLDKVSTFLCKECLNKTISRNAENVYGIGIIDFTNGKIKPFETNIVGFEIGDYIVRCDFEEPKNTNDRLKIDIFVVYRPLRYSSEPEA